MNDNRKITNGGLHLHFDVIKNDRASNDERTFLDKNDFFRHFIPVLFEILSLGDVSLHFKFTLIK